MFREFLGLIRFNLIIPDTQQGNKAGLSINVGNNIKKAMEIFIKMFPSQQLKYKDAYIFS